MSTVHDPMKAPISLHGLGFIQVQLQGGLRLHVWHPDLPRRSCFEHSAIHNHRFRFESLVLVGVQINIKYSATPFQPATHTLYRHDGERQEGGGRPWTPDGDVHMLKTSRHSIPAGTLYRMQAYDFHRTEPGGNGKVATIMQKLSQGDAGAHSACEIGIEPDADFDRFQLSPAQLWTYVLDVLGAPGQVVGAPESTAMTADAFLILTDEISQVRRAQATLIEKAIALCDAVENKEDLPLHKYAMRAGRLVNEVRHLATELSRPQSGSPEGLDQPQQGGDQ